MERMINKLRESRGDALIFGIAVLVFVMLLVITTVTAVRTRATAEYLRNISEAVLDTYTVSQGRIAADSFKNGCDYTAELDEELYITRLREALDIIGNVGTEGGRIRFELSDIRLAYTVDNQIKSTVSFRIKIPLYWGDTRMMDAEGVVRIRSQYAIK